MSKRKAAARPVISLMLIKGNQTASPNKATQRRNQAWSNRQLMDVNHQKISPLRWTLRDKVTLAVWNYLSCRRPWLSYDELWPKFGPDGNASWADHIADRIMAVLEEEGVILDGNPKSN
jgi:hypothetical protein